MCTMTASYLANNHPIDDLDLQLVAAIPKDTAFAMNF